MRRAAIGLSSAGGSTSSTTGFGEAASTARRTSAPMPLPRRLSSMAKCSMYLRVSNSHMVMMPAKRVALSWSEMRIMLSCGPYGDCGCSIPSHGRLSSGGNAAVYNSSAALSSAGSERAAKLMSFLS